MDRPIKTAYFGISKSNRPNFDNEIQVIKDCLLKHKITLEVFVDKYHFNSEDEKEMMKIAFEELDQCNLLIVEVSKKAIGVGVEVGYAKGKNIPIIYLRKTGSRHSSTVGGSSDYFMEYYSLENLRHGIEKILSLISG